MASAGTQGFTAKRRKRTINKYAHIADIPVDVFLEVATFLSPQDLLQLSRVSHHFRKIMLHPSSENMWVVARRNMKNPPPPPKGLSESKYASLLFEHRCFGCGTVRAGRKDYNMSVRFCARCWKNK
ncbi:hypothetical protein BC629DRAFT_569801 [Irpex lacteus]|nr:hypothetical protein BC629DRAFT_569801 [Irpex lacteus]